MESDTAEAELAFEEAVDNVIVPEPRSSSPEDDLITPGEFDIA